MLFVRSHLNCQISNSIKSRKEAVSIIFSVLWAPPVQVQGTCSNFQSQPQANISSFEGRALSPASSNPAPRSYLRALGASRGPGVNKMQQLHLDAHHLSFCDPGNALKMAGGALRVFLCFKYPQSKLLKISAGSPQGECTADLWPQGVGWLIRQHLCAALECSVPRAGKVEVGSVNSLRWDCKHSWEDTWKQVIIMCVQAHRRTECRAENDGWERRFGKDGSGRRASRGFVDLWQKRKLLCVWVPARGGFSRRPEEVWPPH